MFVDLVRKDDAGYVSAEHLRVRRKARQFDGLNAHADLKIRLWQHPVDISVLHLDHDTVGAHGTAGTRLSPAELADFKLHGSGKGFRGYSIQLNSHARCHLEVIMAKPVVVPR